MRLTCTCLLLFLLSSCNFGDPSVDPYTEFPNAPEPTTTGNDKLVCIVNADLNAQVYREVSNGIMSIPTEEVRVYNTIFSPGANLRGYTIWASRNGDDDKHPDTDIEMAIPVDSAHVNTHYRILGGGYSSYSVGGYNEYFVNEEASSLVFTRIDTLVAAGHFVFRAINKANDTVIVRGYFDIPFRTK